MGSAFILFFANAGIIEETDFFSMKPVGNNRPPEGDLLSADVDLTDVI